MRVERLPAAMIADLRQVGLFRCIFIESNEIAKRNWKASVFVCAEWVLSERDFKPGDNDGKAQRIQTRIEQRKIVSERREPLVLLPGHLLELFDDLRFRIHVSRSEERRV